MPLKVVTDVIMAAHGEAASLPKSERQATAVLNALADAGCIVIHNHPLEPPLAVALRPQDVPPGPWRDLVAQRR